jgi:hypothetical protein
VLNTFALLIVVEAPTPVKVAEARVSAMLNICHAFVPFLKNFALSSHSALAANTAAFAHASLTVPHWAKMPFHTLVLLVTKSPLVFSGVRAVALARAPAWA